MKKVKRKAFKEGLTYFDSAKIGKMLESAKTLKEQDGYCGQTVSLYCLDCPLDLLDGVTSCVDYKITNNILNEMNRNSIVKSQHAKDLKRFHKNIDKVIEVLEECK